MTTYAAHVKLKESARRQISGKTFSPTLKANVEEDNLSFYLQRHNDGLRKRLSPSFLNIRRAQQARKVVIMRKGIFLFCICFVLFLGSASAQSRPDTRGSNPADPSQTPTPNMGSPEEEIIRRAEIRHAEESHKEMVERADETAQIGDELLASFKKNQTLGRDELKKLDRMEKLARKIRGSAGGSDDDEKLENPPGKLEAAVARLAELAGILKKSVQKTSRLVISAAVIQNSNELIELIRHIRSFQKP